MRILLVHDYYRSSAPSGEDIVVGNERRMLEARGNEVIVFERFNDDIDDSTLIGKITVAKETIWAQEPRQAIQSLVRARRPDVAHVHNTFPIISPSIYGVLKAENIPVVQTLHNFRLFCPQALLLRNGQPCERCISRGLWESVRYGCYRESRAATSVLAGMLYVHRTLGTFRRNIDRYIVLSNFAALKAIAAGIPSEKLVIKSNFAPEPPAVGDGGGGYVAYVGRLVAEKGVRTMLRAWQDMANVPLKVIGDGPLRRELEDMTKEAGANIEFLGMQRRETIWEILSRAEATLVPSECYEGFPMVIAESYSCGTPVIASRLGSLEEIVMDGDTGHLVRPGDVSGLREAVNGFMSDRKRRVRMRAAARRYFEHNLTEQRNYERLMTVYEDVIREKDHG